MNRLNRNLDLKTHAADIHELKTEFKCPICSSIFHWKRALQVHVPIVHSNERRMYSCSYVIRNTTKNLL